MYTFLTKTYTPEALRRALAEARPDIVVATTRPFSGWALALPPAPPYWLQAALGPFAQAGVRSLAERALDPEVARRTVAFIATRLSDDTWRDFACTPMGVLLVGSALTGDADGEADLVSLLGRVVDRQAARVNLNRIDDLQRLALHVMRHGLTTGSRADWRTRALHAGVPNERVDALMSALPTTFLRAVNEGDRLEAWPLPVWQYVAACELRDNTVHRCLNLDECVQHPLVLGAVEYAGRLVQEVRNAETAEHWVEALAKAGAEPNALPPVVAFLASACGDGRFLGAMSRHTSEACLRTFSLRYRTVVDLNLSNRLQPFLAAAARHHRLDTALTAASSRFSFLRAMHSYDAGDECKFWLKMYTKLQQN